MWEKEDLEVMKTVPEAEDEEEDVTDHNFDEKVKDTNFLLEQEVMKEAEDEKKKAGGDEEDSDDEDEDDGEEWDSEEGSSSSSSVWSSEGEKGADDAEYASASSSSPSSDDEDDESSESEDENEIDEETGEYRIHHKTGKPHPLEGWSNRPKAKVVEDGNNITVKSNPRTDYWRKTRFNDNTVLDNGSFYWHKVKGNFEIAVRVCPSFENMYDKAGIMVREHSTNYITSGMEFYEDNFYHSTCVTKEYTDWSLTPIDINEVDAAEKGCWFGLMRQENTYTTFYSVDGAKWYTTRQGFFDAPDAVRVGLFLACPLRTSFRVTFSDYRERRFD